MRTLVFKIRDNMAVTRGSVWARLLQLPAPFFDQADRYHATLNARPPSANPILSFINQFQVSALEQALKLSPFLPTSVYGDEAADLLTQLAQRVATYRPVKRRGQQPPRPAFPNLLNYFQLPLPDAFSDELVRRLLNGLGGLLTPKKIFPGITLPPLLEYVYLKSDPVPMSPPYAATPGQLAHRQVYLADMKFPAPEPVPATGGQPTPPPIIGLTILEAHGWYTNHSEFSVIRDRQPDGGIEFVLHGKKQLQASAPPLDLKPAKTKHGTQILGLLVANQTDADAPANTDLCRGILPPHAVTVRLVSCLTGKSVVNEKKELVGADYHEAQAMLAAILKTPSGESILIEVGVAGTKFPLDVQPAIYELLVFADYLDITVIAAAGNKNAVLNTLAPGETPLLTVKDLTDGASNTGSKSYWSIYRDTEAGRTKLARLARSYVGSRPPTTGPQTTVPSAGQFSSVDDFLAHYNETPSPAILVGAAQRADTGTFSTYAMSSSGERVRVFAQGHHLPTVTPPDSPQDPGMYTDSMSDTSGAAAIVAGMVALWQLEAKRADPKAILSPTDIADRLAKPPGAGVFATGPTQGVVPLYTNTADHAS